MSAHTDWKQLAAELGFRAAKELYAEERASTSQQLSLLIAKRLRAFNIRQGVKNNDARDLHEVQVSERPTGPAGPPRFNRFAGNSSL